MNTYIYTSAALIMFSLTLQDGVLAQDASAGIEEVSTAILDTSIPFAIGAREGEQTIRGSFGWPTFQEGFVEGVYFRFDPDGYARFSTSPRLDEDVFEVICQNAVTICVAQKNGLEIGLTENGGVDLRISGITESDSFFISDRKRELPLPNSILGPIDQRLEALLSSGGDLIIRRQLETIQSHSLVGLMATITYLKWVAQNQASFVFPRNWPAPSQNIVQDKSNFRKPNTWQGVKPLAQTRAVNWQSNHGQDTHINTAREGASFEQMGGIGQQSRQAIVSGANNYEVQNNGFSAQAQGRNLSADVNRFSTQQTQASIGSEGLNARNTQYGNPQLALELSKVNQSLRNLEIQIENLTTRFSHELQLLRSIDRNRNWPDTAAYNNITRQKNGPQMTHSGGGQARPRNDASTRLAIETILEGSLQENGTQSRQSGEISVKKNIVERLIEELNEAKQPKAQPNLQDDTSTGEFISLSDYINKVIQDENLK